MTTNQLIREIAKVLKDAPPVQLSDAEKRDIAVIGQLIRTAK